MAERRSTEGPRVPSNYKTEGLHSAALTEKVAGLMSLSAAVIFLVRLQIAPLTDTTTIAASLICVIMFAVYLSIKREWSTGISGVLLICSWLVALLLGAAFTNGANSPIMVLAPVTPLMAAVLRGKDWGWYSSIAICLGIAIYGALEQRGYFPGRSGAELELNLYEFWLVLSVLVGALVGHHMAIENDKLANTLREHARIDYLTKIPNRMAINEALANAANDARRGQQWLSVMMIDIDHFKLFNDVNGHAAGDECLKKVAAALANALHRPYDFVGRYGGEEFTVILPRTDPDGARIVAEALRNSILGLGLSYRGRGKEPVTITIGLASAPGALDGHGEKLLKEADAALYAGKEYGRNRVIPSVLDQSGNMISESMSS